MSRSRGNYGNYGGRRSSTAWMAANGNRQQRASILAKFPSGQRVGRWHRGGSDTNINRILLKGLGRSPGSWNESKHPRDYRGQFV